MTETRKGLLYGIAAYSLWGVVPLFWKLIDQVDPVEVLAHRAVWGLGAFIGLALIAGVWPEVRVAARDRRTLAVNWGVFVFSVATGHLLDASLGYFINPLVSVALGMIAVSTVEPTSESTRAVLRTSP